MDEKWVSTLFAALIAVVMSVSIVAAADTGSPQADPTAPPATITITGQNMDPTYAMPRVYFYDQNQTVWLQVTATSASADGTQIVIPASQVTFPDTYYAAVVFVLRANGSWDAVGGAAVRVFTPISPPPGGGGGCTGRNCLPQC